MKKNTLLGSNDGSQIEVVSAEVKGVFFVKTEKVDSRVHCSISPQIGKNNLCSFMFGFFTYCR